MNYKYTLTMPRKTFDGLCRYLQHWGQVYGRANAVVLRGPLQKGATKIKIGALATDVEAGGLSLTYTSALHALGRAKVKLTEAIIDLRDLSDEESEALTYVYATAKLKEQQYRALERLRKEITVFQELPAMVRIAIAAKD